MSTDNIKMRSRRILAYFLESKLWKTYEYNTVNNYAYWIVEDHQRAERMFESRPYYKGYSIEEYILDMLTCISESTLKTKTKKSLYIELDELERYHEEKGTLKRML